MNVDFSKLVARLDRDCQLWHRWLRRSVRLYLVLREPHVPAQRIEALLRAVERNLLWHLLQQEPGMALGQAWAVLEKAQGDFMSDPARVHALLAEMSADQAVNEPLE
ncbi:MAG TPA: hypothetical protein VF630_10785 [Hymenobacter sp.]|jgi:hypothetical protein